MFNLQGSEIIVILLIALVVLGPEKLPDAIRRFSQTYAELKKMGSGFQSELKSALDEPMREMRETADLIRDSADPDKVAARSTQSTSPPAPPTAATDAGAPTPAPGDPPLVDEPADEPDGAAPVESGPRINHVAAGNSSSAITAAAAAPEVAHDTPRDQAAAPDADRDKPQSAGGPAFHSAAPPAGAQPAADDGSDGGDGRGDGDAPPPADAYADESSDETATA